jgi:hypothetical protein
VGSKEFSLYKWDEVRSRGIAPRFASTPSDDDRNRLEFLAGARLYGLELGEPGRFGELQPQQLLIADTLSGSYDQYAVEIPRRASKTTSIFLMLLGRCVSRPGYQVTFSAQNGVAGSRRLREWGQRLDAVNPPDDQELPPWLRGRPRATKAQQRHLALFGDELVHAPEQQRRGFRILRGEVGKGIYFDNGSTFLVLKPDADAYRGEAADVSWIDEAQEVDPLEGSDLLAAILPLQDTKPGSSIIVSGTAGEARVGPFWDYVNRLRSGDKDMGGLDYAIDELTPWELIENEETAMQLLLDTHPGVGTLTTIEKMLKNYRSPVFGRPNWAREYLSFWPEAYGTVAINEELWTAGRLVKKPVRPARVAFGMSIKPGGSSAAIVAAWRNSAGVAYVEVVEHKPGTSWIPKLAQHLTSTYRLSTIAYDDIAEGKATATEMQVLSPKPKMRVQTYRETAAGCVQFLRDLERGTIRHSGQVGLDAAVKYAGKREVRGDQGVWLWTPAEMGADIACLDAATRALRNWDQHYARQTSGAKPIMGD